MDVSAPHGSRLPSEMAPDATGFRGDEMSIVRDRKDFVPTCDICGCELDLESSFADAVQAQKEANWKNVKIKGDWEIWCTDCQCQARP